MSRALFSFSLVMTVAFAAPAVGAGEIALSFDDAPLGGRMVFSGMERTRTLIRKLDSLDVPEVVFFCTTDKLHGPTRWKRLRMYAAAGHRLANHSHAHLHPGTLGTTLYIADLDRAHDSLSRLDGFVRWYRYPFLDEGTTRPVRDSIRAALALRGYRNGYVTVDNYEWYMEHLMQSALSQGAEVDYETLREIYVETIWEGVLFYDRIAREVLGRSPKHVLVLHETDITALYVDNLITRIREAGWTIITPTEAYGDSIADWIPDVLMNNQGRVAAIAREGGYRGRDLVHPAEDTDYLDSLFAARKVFSYPDGE